MATLIDTTVVTEVFLNPGDFHFHCPVPGRSQPNRLHTLLGSCVSIILWHPERRLAGMSHAILPSRSRRSDVVEINGRYCDEAVALFCRELGRTGAQPRQFHAYLVGGGKMYLTEKGTLTVGDRNIEAARTHLEKAGFQLRAEHVGKEGYRKVELDLKSGDVSVTFANKRINLTST